MINRFIHKTLLFTLIFLSVSAILYAQDELCTDGILLFREDFGGNDPSDPAVGRTAVSGMSSGYQQIYKLQTSDPGTGFGAGCYLVAKRGYRNSTNANYSVWHIMDDHTYFGDTTRGYFLEIDGKGSGNDVFYSTVIDGLCEGSRLTFSAYVANLTTAGQYNGWRSRNYVHPKLSFVLTHPQTGAELARYNTDTIAHDWTLFSTPSSWKYSANWQLVGMNFIVPEGIDSVRLSIRNNASGSSTGNDFALDDIEIRLCLTPDTIKTDTLVCDTVTKILWRDSLYQIADTLRDTIFNSCGIDSVYYLLSVQTEHCKEPLCLDGILLFREDFGGNNPEDPKISTTPVSGMSYTQVTNDALGSMGAGNYLVTKQGYCNGNGTSQWHLQDDHTYFGDLTRGYFLEIDGRGDHSAFYSTTIDGLCEGIGLTFSAYVANVMTWGMYMGRPGVYAYPRLKFVLTNPLDNLELATYDTGDIPFDSAFIGDNMCWQQSVEWQLVGMNFTVPNGVDQIQLTIYNNTTGSNGNDFALDDIEIHLCMTPDTVTTDTLVCDTISKIQWREKAFVMADTLRDTVFSSCGFDSIYYVLNIQTEHCEEPEPVLCTDGILLFREDFGGNDVNDPRVSSTPVPGMSYRQSTHGMGSGTYMVTKSGYCNGDTTGWTIPGADLSTKRSQWYIQDDHTYPNDRTRGYFLEIDGSGGTQQFYQTEISGLCEGIELTFSAYVANVFTWFQYDWYTRNRGPVISPCLKFVLTNPQTGAILAEKNTKEIPFDENLPAKTDWQYSSAWHLVGMNFTVPVGVDAIRLTIYNNVTNGNGNDFAIDDIEIHLCTPPSTIEGETEVCANQPTTLTANFANDGTFAEPLEYKWWHSTDSVTWTEMSGFNGGILSFDAIQKADSGWYKVAVSGDGNIESVNCRAVSDPFRLKVNECEVIVQIISPDSVCPNDPYVFRTEIENESLLPTPVQYQWWYRSPEQPRVWTKMVGGNQRELQISSFKTQHVGWYKLMVAGSGDMDDENKRKESEEFFVTFKKCEPDLCLSGTLLYRDDFGGNDPSESRVGSTPVPGMTYRQLLSDKFGQMGNSAYLVAKEGYCNGDTAALRRRYGYLPGWGSQWILQDDHTYPNDRSRGYLVEIDGAGTSTPFYSTTISDLCPGAKLTFSAYVVNVHFYEQVQKFYRVGGYNYVYPRLKFVLKNPQTDQILASQSTGDIQPDVTKSWNIHLRESAEWQLVGMEFIVPEGVDSVQMFIYNDVDYNGTGNDFALDDIEIHLCAPPVTIEGETEVCANQPTTLTANFANDGTFAEPLEYKWWHSTDSVTWTEMSGFNGKNLLIDAVQKSDSGWYKVAVSGDGNIESVNCRAVSDPFLLKVNKCTEDLCIDGILLFREDFGGNDPDDPIVGTQQVPGMDYSRYTQRLNADQVTGQPGLFWLIKSGYYHADTTGGRDPMRNHSNWYLQDDHTYPNDKTRGYLLEIDGMGGTAPFYSTVVHDVCPGTRLTFSAYVANVNKASNYIDGIHAWVYPKLKFEIEDAKTHTVLGSHSTGDIPYDPDLTVNTDFWYSSKWYLHGMTFTMPEAVDSIRLTIYNDVMNNGAGNDFALDDIEIRLCMTPDTVRKDTLLCDTISKIQWREKAFVMTDTLRDTLRSSCGFDSIYYVMKVETEHCEPPIPPCPELITITADTMVCDTLMPYRWRDTLFTEPARYEILYKNQRDCDSLLYILTLSTEHCERPEPPTPPDPPTPPEPECYPIIVNKYNWVLLVDNVAVQKLFPNRTVQAYQWYKNGEPIPGANEDDYSEHDELHGEFQMILKLDGDEDICSNILEINIEQHAEQPIQVRIFNSHGMPVSENQITRGIYLYRYEQGEKQWTEKKLVQ